MYICSIRRYYYIKHGSCTAPIAMYVTFTVIPYYGHGVNNYVNLFMTATVVRRWWNWLAVAWRLWNWLTETVVLAGCS